MTTHEMLSLVGDITDVAETLADRLRRDGGFTFDPATGETIDVGDRTGWAVARAGTEITVDPDEPQWFARALTAAAADAATSGGLVGGWYSTERRSYMVEVSDVHEVDRTTALAIGMRADQETVFDLATGETAAVPQWGNDG